MIHTVFVSAGTEPAELKKLVRKKLMTGGAVIRLSDDLPGADLEQIFERFAPEAERYSLAAEVLVQLAGHAAADEGLREKLATVSIPEVSQALKLKQ